MNLFGKLFGNDKEVALPVEEVDNFRTFWVWFEENHEKLKTNLIAKENIEDLVLKPLAEAVGKIQEGIYFVVGVDGDDNIELVLTADGVIQNIPVIEALIAQAPQYPGWRFEALKAASQMEGMGVRMDEYEFSLEKIQFYVNEHVSYPDLIDINIVYDDFKDKDADLIQNGCFIFLDNYLGELAFASQIDEVSISARVDNEVLIPVAKLKDYLVWREKEFVERYQGIRRDTEEDEYIGMEGTLENEKPLIAVVNKTLMEWDAKPSHPWVLRVEIDYKADPESGMPATEDYALMDEFEENLMSELVDENGYLNVGRQTADGLREIFFACKDFREPVFSLNRWIERYESSFEKMNYVIYKDKYWRSLDFFHPNKI